MTLTFDVIGQTVRDMATTLAFYRRLGLSIPDSDDAEGHVEVDLSNGMKLTFDTEEVMASFQEGYTPPEGQGRTALAFRAAAPAEVDQTYAAMLAAGAEGHLAPFDAFWGQRYASLRDPDGTPVDLYAALPAGSA